MPGSSTARDDARTAVLIDAAACEDARTAAPSCGHEGDAQVERWYREHHARLRAFCSKQLGDASAAEDVAQETLLRAWTNRDLFEPDADIGPWLFRVARNLCTDTLRARRRLVHGATIPDQPDVDGDPADPIVRAETDEVVRTAFASLTERHRQALLLRDVHGIEYQDLAARMGVSEDTARAVLFRARRGLRKRFMEVARATAMLALWPILRLRARRAATGSIENAISVAGHAVLGAAAAAALLLLPGVGRSPAEQPSHDPRPSMTLLSEAGTVGGSLLPPADLSPDRSSTEVSDDEGVLGASIPKVGVSASRRGEVHAGAGAHNPATGDDAEVWADIWREAGDGESVVLNQFDQFNETACAGASGTCAALDGILSKTEGP